MIKSGKKIVLRIVWIKTNNKFKAWKNRCSEKRERINAQNMQIALEKEFQAKEQLLEENNNLRQELDVKQHRISDLQMQIEATQTDVVKYQHEINELKQQLLESSRRYANISQQHPPQPSQQQQPQQQQPSAQLNNHHVLPVRYGPVSEFDNIDSQHANMPPALNNLLSSPSSTSTINTAIVDTSSYNTTHHIGDHELTSDNENYSHLEKIASASTTTTSGNGTSKPPGGVSSIKQASMSSSASAVSSNVSNDTTNPVKGHRFEVVTFNTIERCEYCSSIMYGICRQAVRCREKTCSYLCHPKCRQYLPTNCPININQRVKLKNVDFTRGTGTLMQGTLKVPKLGGVKKGWQEHYVFLSNARLFVCPMVDNKPSIVPVQIIDIRDPQFTVGSVSESDVIHASKKDIPCIMKVIFPTFTSFVLK